MSLLGTFRERRPFPGQDPWVVAHEGSFLLVQSAGGDSRIVVRRFGDLASMHRNVETVVWAPARRSAGRRNVWAPELHLVEGWWYLYYAAGDGSPGSHRMYAAVAEDPFGPYHELGPVRDPEHDFWAIDLTVFRQEGRLYGVWSGWNGAEDRFPQNLYISPMSNPWTISGERRCLSRPELSWETSVAAVNEGPEVIRHPLTGRLFILFAADASWTQAYKTGLLEWTGGDVGDPASWHKQPQPWFNGGGHSCLVDTPAGPHLVYHCKMTGDHGWADREIRTTPVVWDPSGCPVVGNGAATAATPAGSGGAGGAGMSAPGYQVSRAETQ